MCAECAVGRGMGVAADNSHSWQRGALFWPNDVNYTLAQIIHFELEDIEFTTIIIKR